MLQITNSNFDTEVLECQLPVMLDFFSSGCAPCSMLEPLLQQLEKEYAGKVHFGTVNVEEEPDLASAFAASSVPMLVVLSGGMVKAKAMGFQTQEELKALLVSSIDS